MPDLEPAPLGFRIVRSGERWEAARSHEHGSNGTRRPMRRQPGFANRCPSCSEPAAVDPISKRPLDADERKKESEANEARRRAMKELLYQR
jgi:hypothetical protein